MRTTLGIELGINCAIKLSANNRYQQGTLLNPFEFNIVCPAIVPTLSAELVANGSMEVGDPPSSWVYGISTGSSVADERTGGSGSKSMKSLRGAGQPAIANVIQTFSASNGKWFLVSGWTKNIDASGGVSIGLSWAINGVPNTSAEWKRTMFTGFFNNAGTSTQLQLKRNCDTEGQSGLFDDLTCKSMPLSSMISLVGTSKSKEGEWFCNPIVAKDTQVGMILNYKDEDNFILAIIDRANSAYGDVTRARLLKRVAGVYQTEVIGNTVTYVEGGELRITNYDNKYSLFYVSLSVGITTEIADDVFGFDFYGFNSYDGNSVGQIGKNTYIETTIFPQLSDVTISATTILPINFVDGILYGAITSGSVLNSSIDYGANWTEINSTGISTIRKILKTGDGEVVLIGSDGVYKSSGWATNPATATFARKQACSVGSYPLQWGFDVYQNKVIFNEYAANPRDPAKKYYLSTDNGETYSVILDLLPLYPNYPDVQHPHAACFDHKNGNIYASNGDGFHNCWFSSDNGANWEILNNGAVDLIQPTTMLSAKYGIVCGTDNIPQGVFKIDRNNKITYMTAEVWTGFTFAKEACRSEQEFVYTVFGGINGTLKCTIYASDGRFANKIYTVEYADGIDITKVMAYNGKLVCTLKKADNSYNILTATI